MLDINYRLPYWQNGSSELKEVAGDFVNYVNSGTLGISGNIPAPSDEQLLLLRGYIITWMNYTGWQVKESDKTKFDQLKTTANGLLSFPDTKAWLNSALYFGIDPF